MLPLAAPLQRLAHDARRLGSKPCELLPSTVPGSLLRPIRYYVLN
jgi:hypothetical protein